jgi:hypothetical protein
MEEGRKGFLATDPHKQRRTKDEKEFFLFRNKTSKKGKTSSR